jgi:uncharacterized membrane protein
MQMRVDVGTTVESSLETAFRFLVKFEDYHLFMEGVEAVRSDDFGRLHWRLNRGGREVDVISRITANLPNQNLEWQDEAGTGGVRLSLRPHGPREVAITMQVTFDPEDYKMYGEHSGGVLGYLGDRARADLARYKEIVEALCPSKRGLAQPELTGAL